MINIGDYRFTEVNSFKCSGTNLRGNGGRAAEIKTKFMYTNREIYANKKN